MPELPEVETIVTGLKANLLGRRVKELVFISPHLKKSNYQGLSGRRLTAGEKSWISGAGER